jgi:serine/threonine protein kinase
VQRNRDWRDHYRQLQMLYRGRGCQVFSVRSKSTSEVLAVKLVALPRADSMRARRRALQEGKLLAALNGRPDVVGCREAFVSRAGGHLALVMEFCACGSLRLFLDNHRLELSRLAREAVTETYLGEQRVLGWLASVAGALAFLHSRGYAHGDVSLSNVFLQRDLSVRLGDFGAALRAPTTGGTTATTATTTTTAGAGSGTTPGLASSMSASSLSSSAGGGSSVSLLASAAGAALTLPPEHFGTHDDRGALDPVKYDAWALGIALHELCSLRHPFAGKMIAPAGADGSPPEVRGGRELCYFFFFFFFLIFFDFFFDFFFFFNSHLN